MWTVDGCSETGAIQDYLVGFHQLTILTGQGNMRDLLVVSKGRAAFPKLRHFVSYDRSSRRGPQATTIPDFPHLCQYTIFLCVRMQSLWGDISGSAMGLLLSLKKTQLSRSFGAKPPCQDIIENWAGNNKNNICVPKRRKLRGSVRLRRPPSQT